MTDARPWALWLWALCLCAACDATDQPEPPVPVPAESTLEEYSDARLHGLLQEATSRVGADPQGQGAVELARGAARIARVLSERGVPPESLMRAGTVIRQVTRGQSHNGLCKLGIDLARFELQVNGDRDEARTVALATRDRFTGLADADACMRELSGLLARLSPGETIDGPATQPTSPARRAVLQQVEVFGGPSGAGRRVRAVLYFDGVAPYRRSERPQEGELPRRVHLDVEGASLSTDLASVVPVDSGGLRALRLFVLPGGTLRATYELSADADYRMFVLSSPYRVVFDAALRGPSPRKPGEHRVLLDPGHGGRNPGAKGPNGLRESDVALSLAKRVRRDLRQKDPDLSVLLTREDDREVTLEERAAIANAVDADLFISIHLNASHSPQDKGGVSTFVLDTTDDTQALRLAARENGTELAAVGALERVLATLYRKDQTAHSLSLARSIHRHTLAGGRRVLSELPNRGVKRALFYVLVGVTMPSVLVEASFITRPEEEQALRTDEYRDALAGGIANGIIDYLATLKR